MNTTKKTAAAKVAPARNDPGASGSVNSEASSPVPVLLALTGMSPAVLTETVWALAHEPEPVVPARVLVATTSMGRAEIRKQLFEPVPGWNGVTVWEALRDALTRQGLDLDGRLRFGITADDVRVFTVLNRETGCSEELTDIRTAEHNAAAADFLLEQVRGLVENPDTQLITSIAGGRKTMGALLYSCVSLVGRETDRLTHVLVNEPYEILRGFYFPGQPGGSIADRAGKGHEPTAATVELADLPFVPLRNLFLRELGRGAGSFTGLIQTCRRNVRERVGEAVRLIVERSRREIEVNGVRLPLAHREQLLMLFLALRLKEGGKSYGAHKEAIDDLNTFREELTKDAAPDDYGDWRGDGNLRSEWDEQDLRRTLSSLRSKIQGLRGDASMLASCLPERGRFSLALPASLVHIKP